MGLDIIVRKNWTNEPAPGAKLKHPVRVVYAHCTVQPDIELSMAQRVAIKNGDQAAAWKSLAADAAGMRNVDRIHKAKGWAGFGYNFAGFDDGTCWEGRGWSHIGAQVEGHNSTSLGYAWFINGDKRPPTDEAWSTFAKWLLLGIDAGIITANFDLRPHRMDDTHGKSCPGWQTTDRELDDLERWVKTIAGKG